MWRLTCLLLLCFQPYSGFAQFGKYDWVFAQDATYKYLAQQIFQHVHDSLSGTQNLGNAITQNIHQSLFPANQQIFQQVHNSLLGTQNLGAQISANVHQQLAPLQNLGLNIQNQVHQNLQPVYAMGIKNNMANGVGGITVATYYGPQNTHNLGAQISANVHRQLAPLQNLGRNIHNRVQQNLMPVYALGIKHSMARGVGGITVATYYGPQTRSFIIQNGERSICNGNIQGAQCIGSLEPFDIETREDFCFATSYASVNNRICLSSGSVNVQIYNGQINCESADGAPTLIVTRKEYRNMCGNRMPWQILYRYYANPNDPRAIPIPNSNPYVMCNNSEPGVCEFEGENTGGSGNGMAYSSSSGFNVYNSYN